MCLWSTISINGINMHSAEDSYSIELFISSFVLMELFIGLVNYHQILIVRVFKITWFVDLRHNFQKAR